MGKTNKYCQGSFVVKATSFKDDNGKDVFRVPSGWQANKSFMYNPESGLTDQNSRTIGFNEFVFEPGEKSELTDKSKEELIAIFENNVIKNNFKVEKWDHKGKVFHFHMRNINGITEENRHKVGKYLTKLLCVDGYDSNLIAKNHLVAIEDVEHHRSGVLKTFVEIINDSGKNIINQSILDNVLEEQRFVEEHTIDIDFDKQDVLDLYSRLIEKELPSGSRQGVLIKNFVIGLRIGGFSNDERLAMIKKVGEIQRMDPNSMTGWFDMDAYNHSEVNKYFEDIGQRALYFFTDKLIEKLDKVKGDIKERPIVLKNLFKSLYKEDPYQQIEYRAKIKAILGIKNEKDMSAIEKEYSVKVKPHYDISRKIMKDHSFVSLSERRLFVYKDGMYHKDGYNIISKLTEIFNEDQNDNKFVKEVLGTIFRLTVQDNAERINEADDRYVCLENGILDTETLQIMKHDPSFVFLTKLPVRYDPEADTKEVKKYFKSLVSSSDALVLEEMFGWFLIASYTPQNIVMLNGGGENGKSKFLNIIDAFLGKENTSCVPLLALKSGSRFNTSSLFGKFANLVSETPSKAFEDVELLKQLTGGDPITAEFKTKDLFKFINRAKIVNACNEVPEAKDSSRGFFRRPVIIDFIYTFNKDNRIDNIVEKMTTEKMLSAFLNVALEGMKRLKDNGFFSGYGDFDNNAEKFLKRSNATNNFLSKFQPYDSGRISGEELMEMYNEFCEGENIPAQLTKASLYTSIKHRWDFVETSVPIRIDGKQLRGIKGLRKVVDIDEDNTQNTPNDIMFRGGY